MIRWALCCMLGVVMASGLLAQEQERRPNVLLVTIDDLNDWVEPLKGHPQTQTPSLMRLAQRGVVFTNAHCPSPLCGPSRTAMLTGLAPTTTGVYGHIQDKMFKKAPILQQTVTIPEWFKQHGYRTYATGKVFHNGTGPRKMFDEVFGRSDFGPRPKQRFQWQGTGTNTDWGAFPAKASGMPDHKNVSWAVEQLGRMERSASRPFFMAVGIIRPHVPWYVPQAWLDRLGPVDQIELPPYLADDLADVPETSRAVHEVPSMPTLAWMRQHGQWRAAVRAYLASVSFADHQLGRLLEALESSPFADDTIIIVTSDHGYHLGEKDRFAKHGLWERATRIPLIVVRPGHDQPVTIDQPVSLIDLFPTLASLTGLPAPEGLEGNDFTPLLEQPDADWPHVALTTWGPENYAVRDRRYRYIRYADGSEELYDHERDPHEWHNLASDESLTVVKKRLAGHMPRVAAGYNPRSHVLAHNEWFKRRLPDDRPVPE